MSPLHHTGIKSKSVDGMRGGAAGGSSALSPLGGLPWLALVPFSVVLGGDKPKCNIGVDDAFVEDRGCKGTYGIAIVFQMFQKRFKNVLKTFERCFTMVQKVLKS